MYSTRYYGYVLLKIEFSEQILEIYSNAKFMKIYAVRTEVFHADGRKDKRTDRQTDMTNLIVA
jgi:hypothetical protein